MQADTTATGALPDYASLVWAYRFRPGAMRAELIPAISDLDGLSGGEGFVWAHFAMPDRRLEQDLARLAHLPAGASEVLTGRDRHLFLSAAPPALAGVMPDFRRELDDELTDIDRFRFVLDDRLILTTRVSPLHAISRVRAEIEAGRSFASPLALFAAITETFERTIEARVDALMDTVDEIEEQLFHERRMPQRDQLGEARRSIAAVHRTLRTLLRLFHRLDSNDQSDLSPDARRVLEQRAHHTAALDQDVVHLQERARLLQDEISSRKQDEMNRSLFLLSVVTILFLPPTLVTGYFGMNTKDLALQNTDGGAFYATILVVAAAAVAWFLLRKLKLHRPAE